ncbi:MAG: dTDP-4-dehydrorhamnose 3,5-epimerase [Ferruginibacter sp.]|nr:dTDP-4-dehydrorhamnose 3,5-epimerase [Ferruginibacter sp.]
MIFEQTILKGNYIIQPEPKGDERGWFMRTYCKELFKQIGHEKEWVQMNHSNSAQKGIVRGLHFQFPPQAEIKLVRCVQGSVFDVAVDLRRSSPTFLKWVGVELSAINKKMMYIPEGFAHGFQTLSENTELIYLHTAPYTPQSEGGLLYNDPAIEIHWPEAVTQVSERDLSFDRINENFKSRFE